MSESRKSLILKLNNCIKRLIPSAHQNSISLGYENTDVAHLCEVFELIFSHEIRIKEFNNTIPLWGFLERLEILNPPCIPLRNAVGAVSCITTLRNPIAKSRAFIRQILNAKGMDESIDFIVKQHKLLKSFYFNDALLCDPTDSASLMSVVRSMKVLSFNLKVDDPSLNSCPPWMEQLIRRSITTTVPPNPPPPGRSKQPQPPKSNSRSSGSSLDSWFRSFESGFDKLIQHVDTATKFIGEKLEANVDQFTPAARPMPPFFGSSLETLVTDSRRCPNSLYNPQLGIPTQAYKMLNYVEQRAQSANLFRQRASVALVNDLRAAVEEEREFPPNVDIAAVSFLLVQWLLQLPDPLLGFDHYEAILACQDMDEQADRIRNLAFLVHESPWFCKPLLVRVIRLLSICVSPENVESNNLNLIAVAVLSTPFLLRPLTNLSPRGGAAGPAREEVERSQMAAAAAGSTTVEFLIANQLEIFEDVRQELAKKQKKLEEKCRRIVRLERDLEVSVDTTCPDLMVIGAEQHQLIVELWFLLTLAEKSIVFSSQKVVISSDPPNPESPTPSMEKVKGKNTDLTVESGADESGKGEEVPSLAEVLAHGRWENCGFIPAETPLKDFHTHHGLIALRCLVGFLKKHRDKGASLVVDFAQNIKTYLTLPQVVMRMTYFAAEALQLLPPPAGPTPNLSSPIVPPQDPLLVNPAGSAEGSATAAPIVRRLLLLEPHLHLRGQGCTAWTLLTEERCFQEVFDLALFSFDDAWRSLTIRRGQLPSADTSSLALLHCRDTLQRIIVESRPVSLELAWARWLELRLLQQEKLLKQQQYLNQTSLHVTQPTTSHRATQNRAVPIQQQRKQVQKSRLEPLQKPMNELSFDDKEVLTFEDGEAPEEKEKRLFVIDSTGDDADDELAEEEDEKDNKTDKIVSLPHNTSTTSLYSAAGSPGKGELPPLSIMEFTTTSRQEKEERSQSTTAAMFHEESTWSKDTSNEELAEVISKSVSGITTTVKGSSKILTPKHIQQIESALPKTHQCYDWNLLYRLSTHGANVGTLIHRVKTHPNVLLVIKDSNGSIFGALITEQLKLGEREKYYGNGTIGVWSFTSGALKYYKWSYKNSYFLITSKDSIALGGGGNFAIYLDGDLNRGSSGPCDTFSSPCLASAEEFQCVACEVFSLDASLPI